MSKKRGQKSYSDVLNFLNPKIPAEIEDDILSAFANYSLESDMTSANLPAFYSDLQLPEDVTKMIKAQDVCIEGTDIISFDKLLKTVFHLLVFMNNGENIDAQWSMLVHACGRDSQFPQVALRNHVLSIKDLQKITNSINMDSGKLVEMMSYSTNGTRVYITWLDFAFLLGKLGHLMF
ncbi:LADA_0G13168g1_1 [Lachancea dasiensis]|uniref:LADA_0G13168g1_1 n=1 Tax=Lachancea dasiensis TaxID=1072105 RepID=A0A1G4JVX7_9SACH|nr:LADA_0G13168g1_1 [Lachancea dasiensis]